MTHTAKSLSFLTDSLFPVTLITVLTLQFERKTLHMFYTQYIPSPSLHSIFQLLVKSSDINLLIA